METPSKDLSSLVADIDRRLKAIEQNKPKEKRVIADTEDRKDKSGGKQLFQLPV